MPLAALLVMVPLPDMASTASSNPFKSSVPEAAIDTSEASGITPDAPNFKVPALMVVVPVYELLVLDKTNIPVPYLVSVPPVLAIDVEANVTVWPLLSRLNC